MSRQSWQARVGEMLDRIEAVPHADELKPDHAQALNVLRLWQLERLRLTYRDIERMPRYRLATQFFVNELYAPKDRTVRYRSLRRILPMMNRLLPERALEALSVALELQALSDELDVQLAQTLLDNDVPIEAMRQADYALAYRLSGRMTDRHYQLKLLKLCGEELDRVVRLPLVMVALSLARQPAKMAGLLDLHEFLDHGCKSFAAMRGADEFLKMITERERSILAKIEAADPAPFKPEWVPHG
jgi:hypothetical protein